MCVFHRLVLGFRGTSWGLGRGVFHRVVLGFRGTSWGLGRGREGGMQQQTYLMSVLSHSQFDLPKYAVSYGLRSRYSNLLVVFNIDLAAAFQSGAIVLFVCELNCWMLMHQSVWIPPHSPWTFTGDFDRSGSWLKGLWWSVLYIILHNSVLLRGNMWLIRSRLDKDSDNEMSIVGMDSDSQILVYQNPMVGQGGLHWLVHIKC